MSNLRLKDHTWDAANVYDSSLGKTQWQINAEVGTSLAGKQETLVSGVNIATINGSSILTSGNIEIQGGGTGEDGYSPVVTISNITGGHRVNITDKTHPQGQNFDVMNGTNGAKGDTGDPAPASAVVPAVESWLTDNITQETGYVIDDSLTVTGAAADAKKTGDELGDIKSAVDGVSLFEEYLPEKFEDTHFNRKVTICRNKITVEKTGNDSSTYTHYSLFGHKYLGSGGSVPTAQLTDEDFISFTPSADAFIFQRFTTFVSSSSVIDYRVYTKNSETEEIKAAMVLNSGLGTTRTANIFGLLPDILSNGNFGLVFTIRNNLQDITEKFWIKTTMRPVLANITNNILGTYTANKAYAEGDTLLVAGILYRATIAIANGEQLIPNTNIAKITIEEQFNEYRSGNVLPLIPAYYFDNNYLYSKADTIRNLSSNSCHGDSFVFITDYHIASNSGVSPKIVDYIIRSTGTRFVAFGGDTQDSYSTTNAALTALAHFKEVFRSVKDIMFCVMGNHDYNDPSWDHSERRLTPEQVYAQLCKPQEGHYTSTDSRTGYCIDNHAQKIRYFFIGCNYHESILSGTLTWLTNEIASTPAGYSILVFSHITFLSDGTIDPEFNGVISALETAKANGSDIIGVIGGHVHQDFSTVTEGGILVISTTCDKANAGSTIRPRGTINEIAFDVVNLDMTERKIYMTRIGYGEDREFSF